jgi:hypothetical protein
MRITLRHARDQADNVADNQVVVDQSDILLECRWLARILSWRLESRHCPSVRTCIAGRRRLVALRTTFA